MAVKRVVIEVPLTKERWRSRVLNIVSGAHGVTSAELEREERDRVVIIGEGVDAAEVTKCLRNNLKYANLVSVGPVEENQQN